MTDRMFVSNDSQVTWNEGIMDRRGGRKRRWTEEGLLSRWSFGWEGPYSWETRGIEENSSDVG